MDKKMLVEVLYTIAVVVGCIPAFMMVCAWLLWVGVADVDPPASVVLTRSAISLIPSVIMVLVAYMLDGE